jgi:hypothetical protein
MTKHGKLDHKIYTVSGLISNVIYGSTLMMGNCGVFNTLTGINIWASYFILILAVQSYIVVGGLRSTFIVITCIPVSFTSVFSFSCFRLCYEPVTGSPDALHDRLT